MSPLVRNGLVPQSRSLAFTPGGAMGSSVGVLCVVYPETSTWPERVQGRKKAKSNSVKPAHLKSRGHSAVFGIARSRGAGRT